MKEKFKIDREKLNEVIEEYREEIQNKRESEKARIRKHYSELVINILGTEALKEAINYDVLRLDAERILNGRQIQASYSNEDVLMMLEGLSNYEIVGDWQYFRTVESQYLFKLPENMQELFAENFAIGNQDAKECLLELWKNHIATTGTDVIRKSSPGSTNNITIQCDKSDIRYMIETMR